MKIQLITFSFRVNFLITKSLSAQAFVFFDKGEGIEEDIEELKENCRNREDEVLVNKFIELWRN